MPWPAGRSPGPGGASPIERILAAARALTWPSRLVDLETQACQIVGDEFYERLNSQLTGLHPPQWLRALAEETGAALRASVASRHRRLAAAVGAAVRAGADGTARRHRERDREAGPRALPRHQGSLRDRAGRSGPGRQAAGRPRAGFSAAGNPARRLPGGRGPPGRARRVRQPVPARGPVRLRHGEAPDHWYAWDIDSCWILTVAGAGVFGSAEDALANGSTPSVRPPPGRRCRRARPRRPPGCWHPAWRPGRCRTCCREASPGNSSGSTTGSGGAPAASPAPSASPDAGAAAARLAATTPARCARRS